MIRALTGWLLLAGLHFAGDAQAHVRSESFSRWQFSEQTLSLRFTVSAREATRIPRDHDADSLAKAFADYLDSRIVVAGPESGCARRQALQPLASRPGYLRVEGIWRCSKPPGSLAIHAFFDLAAEHTHFASFEYKSGLFQKLLSREDRVWNLDGLATGRAEMGSSAFFDYVVLGFRHISSGLDHLVFLVALLLVCRGARDLVWAITGFTLGHSITLAFTVLGWVQPNPTAIEAVIGLTIALVAVERASMTIQSAKTLAAVCGFVLLLMMPFAGFPGGSLGATPLAGLALFTFCYLMMSHELDGNDAYRLLITTLFGLVHGFGFAGAFLAGNAGREVIPWALAGFNVGVELGQLFVVAAMLMVGLLFARQARFRVLSGDVLAAGVCGFGVFWFIQRSFS